MHALGFSRNLGDPVISAWDRRAQGSARWYPRAKATKPEETGDRESECSVVPVSWGNLPQGTPRREGSAITWNFWRERWREHRSPETVSTKLQKIAELAREAPAMAFTSLNHYIDMDLLLEAYRRTRKDGAPGIDGRTAKEYEEKLFENLESLLNRFKSGMYKAPPVRRVYIPKGDGTKTRPIGIPTFEDKVLQRAVTMVLEAVYEQEFLDCSYGFRPCRSAHQGPSGTMGEVDGDGWRPCA